MNVLPTDGLGAPARWLIAFTTNSDRWWIRLVPGRFKHVRAFAYYHDTDCWVFYDPALRTCIFTARGQGAIRLMLEWTKNSVVLSMEPTQRELVRLLPFSCTTAIASLLGLPGGALRPNALYRQCLRYGATVVDGNTHGRASGGLR